MQTQSITLSGTKYEHHTHCRVCGSDALVKYIDLGELPLSNNLCSAVTDCPERFPLQVMLCRDCGLSQLSIVVDPNLLFGHYVYRSSINQGYVKHCREMAVSLRAQYGLTADSFHVDIAGNDGALLKEFRDEIGLKILNIDPAENLAGICQARGIPTYTHFWSSTTARRVVNGNGKADLITATNVFAHVDDVKDFIEGVKIVLKTTGVLVMEFPYLIDFIEKGEFDTIYFEHLSYFSIGPLQKLCKAAGLNVMHVEKFDIHGGTVRVHIGYGESTDVVRQYILREYKYRDLSLYEDFAMQAARTIEGFANSLNHLTISGAVIAGFAASAKGNTLLNCAGITCGTMKYIVDETPEKIGKFSPGTHIPIVSMLELQANPPDYLVILSWNFADEIMRKCREAGYKGEFIVPVVN